MSKVSRIEQLKVVAEIVRMVVVAPVIAVKARKDLKR